jgi:hypothetical protein
MPDSTLHILLVNEDTCAIARMNALEELVRLRKNRAPGAGKADDVVGCEWPLWRREVDARKLLVPCWSKRPS